MALTTSDRWLDQEDITEALEEAGIEADGASLDAMKEVPAPKR